MIARLRLWFSSHVSRKTQQHLEKWYSQLLLIHELCTVLRDQVKLPAAQPQMGNLDVWEILLNMICMALADAFHNHAQGRRYFSCTKSPKRSLKWYLSPIHRLCWQLENYRTLLSLMPSWPSRCDHLDDWSDKVFFKPTPVCRIPTKDIWPMYWYVPFPWAVYFPMKWNQDVITHHCAMKNRLWCPGSLPWP